jgi:hypothetical protein
MTAAWDTPAAHFSHTDGPIPVIENVVTLSDTVGSYFLLTLDRRLTTNYCYYRLEISQ